MVNLHGRSVDGVTSSTCGWNQKVVWMELLGVNKDALNLRKKNYEKNGGAKVIAMKLLKQQQLLNRLIILKRHSIEHRIEDPQLLFHINAVT